MSFPTYSEYKSSGVEWLGEVPAQWNLKRLRFVADFNPSKSEIAELNQTAEVSFIPMEAIGDNGTICLEQIRPIEQVAAGYTFFRDGDVTIAKITPCFENGKGAVMRGLTSGFGFGTTELIVARPRKHETTAEYLYWLFVSAPFRKLGEAAMYGAGGQKRVPDEFVRDFTIAFPDVSEQRFIAAFLDRETAKIDALIAEQGQLIALLKEKRQAVISHAVTKGLNPDAPMRDSGVEWLGEIPSHWKVTRLKYATSLIVDCPHETPIYSDDGEYMVIRTADIEEGRIDESAMYRVDQSEYLNRIRRQSLLALDIVYGREGERWGHAALVPADDTYCLGQRMMQFRAASHYCPEFLMWLLNAETTYLQGQIDTVGATSPHVNVGTIRNYALTAPLYEEQVAIGEYLRQEAERFDGLMDEVTRGINLLKERRSTLISAAVTGKIDVRGSA